MPSKQVAKAGAPEENDFGGGLQFAQVHFMARRFYSGFSTRVASLTSSHRLWPSLGLARSESAQRRVHSV